MATLVSPGVAVSVTDESFYVSAGGGTVPLIVVATGQDKLNAAGDATASGTTKANANKPYIVTSQRELSNTFGSPSFQTISGTVQQGSEVNEYGLLAAYSFLGAANRAVVIRADVDLDALTASNTAPAGAPADGALWFDTTNTVVGVSELNSAGAWVAQTVLFPKSIECNGTGLTSYPDGTFGTLGAYAIVTIDQAGVTLSSMSVYKKVSNNSWVKVTRTNMSGNVFALPHTNVPESPQTGDIWFKTTSPLNGTDLSIKKYSVSTGSYTDQNVKFYASDAEAASPGEFGNGTKAKVEPVLNATVNNITVVNGGSGYTAIPTITITGGGGTGGAANASIDGNVSSITVNTGGTGYASTPTISIVGGNSDATATAVMDGTLTAINLITTGAGYTSAPTVSIAGGGAGASGATVTANISGYLNAVNLVDPGEYSSVPSVIISGGGSSSHAQATAVLNGAVTSIDVTVGASGPNSGTNYQYPPTVTFAGTNQSASAQANVEGGIISFDITNQGTGFSSAPTITITSPAGSGAVATGNIVGGVASVVVQDAGSGYTAPPTVVVNPALGDDIISAAVVEAKLDAVLDSVTIDTKGAYEFKPTVTIVRGAGDNIGAGATVNTVIKAPIGAITVTDGGGGFTTTLPTVEITPPAGGIAEVAATAKAHLGRTVTGVTVVGGGSGYQRAPSLQLEVNPGSGSVAFGSGGGDNVPASLTATVQGPVSAVNVAQRGRGFSTPPTITIVPAAGDNPSVGAAASAIIKGDIETAAIGVGGTGYIDPDNVAVTATGAGATGTNFAATVSVNRYIEAVNITNPGKGYNTGGSVTVQVSGGSTPATGTVSFTKVLDDVVLSALGHGFKNAITPSEITVSFTGGQAGGAVYQGDADVTFTGVLEHVEVTNNGSNYDNNQPVTVAFQADAGDTSAVVPTATARLGYGTGATGNAFLNGAITGVTVSNGGSAYRITSHYTHTTQGNSGTTSAVSSEPTVVLGAPDIANLNANGPSSGAATTQAVGEVNLNGGALAGTFVNGESYTTSNGLLITNGGTGYGAGTTITISAPDEGGGTQMTISSVTVVGGVIKAVVLNNVGAGYHRTPTITITNDGGAAQSAEFDLVLEGAVQGINVTTAGTGYSDNPACTLTGGNGTSFAATTAISGILDSIAVTAGGQYYSQIPSITVAGNTGIATATVSNNAVATIPLADPNSATAYTARPAVVVVSANGDEVTGIEIVTRGSAMTVAPTVTITGTLLSGTDNATATAHLSKAISGIVFDEANNGFARGAEYVSVPNMVLSATNEANLDALIMTYSGSDGYTPAVVSPTSTIALTDGILSVTVTAQGSGYPLPTYTNTVLNNISAVITGGTGNANFQLATATPEVSGTITDIVVTNKGDVDPANDTGYQYPVVFGVTYTDRANDPVRVGGDTDATVTGTLNGFLSSITVDTAGTGYGEAPSASVAAPDLQLNTTASGTATVDINGAITSISLTNNQTLATGSGRMVASDTSIDANNLLTSPGALDPSAPVTISHVNNGGNTNTNNYASFNITSDNFTYKIDLNNNSGGTYQDGKPAIGFVYTAGGAGVVASSSYEGELTSITVSSPGNNYQTVPTVQIVRDGSDTLTADGAATANIIGAIASFNVSAAGSGYNQTPTIQLVGNTSASAYATITGVLDSITVSQSGSGYTDARNIAVSILGGNNDALAEAKINGKVTGVSVLNGGSNYQSAPSVTLTGGGADVSAQVVAAIKGPLSSVTVDPNNKGSGYTSAPTISFTGGGQTVPASATGTISASVTGFTIVNAGTGFTSTPTVTLSGGGASSQATATAGINVILKSVTVNAGGTGYTSIPTVSVSGGNPTTPATATAVINSFVSGITVSAGGSGYVNIPTITVSGGNGTGATATATNNISDISSFTIVDPGSGYVAVPIITLSGGGVTNRTASAEIEAGKIVAVTLGGTPDTALTGGVSASVLGGGLPPSGSIYSRVIPEEASFALRSFDGISAASQAITTGPSANELSASSTGAPGTNPDGTLWYDGNIELDLYKQSAGRWVPQAVSKFGTKAPATPAGGDIWVDTTDLDSFPVVKEYANNVWVTRDSADQSTPNGVVFADLTSTEADQTNNGGATEVDSNAPDPVLYPSGMLCVNLIHSGLVVKEYNASNAGAFKWRSASGTRADGAGNFGRNAQRAVVVKKMQAALVATNLRAETLTYNLIASPGYPECADEMLALSVDRKETAFCVIDTPFRLAPTGVTAYMAGTGGSENGEDALITKDSKMAVYYPSGYSTNTDGSTVVVPPSHIALRTYAVNDQVAFPWFAPAGLTRGIVSNATNVGYIDDENEFVAVALNQGERDTLYSNKVNPIVNFPGQGLIVFGQKTLSPAESALDRVNVARLVVYIRERLESLARPFAFEPNDELTRANARNAVERFLADIYAKRGLFDFAVVCDTTNNTAGRIDRNELYIDVAIEPAKAAEFIYIPIRVVNTGTL